MSTTQLLIRLPDELARRLKRSVSPRHRSKFIQRLLEEALPPEDDDDPLYRAAMAVEKDEALRAEMEEWETATIEDGIQKIASLASHTPTTGEDRAVGAMRNAD